jgi:hypothetical protein
MVNPEKLNNALFSLHRILVEARAMAGEGDARALVHVLDWAEPLPRLIGEKCADRTAQFKSYVEAIVEREPRFAHALAALEAVQDIEC